jgi:hypothetical protein
MRKIDPVVSLEAETNAEEDMVPLGNTQKPLSAFAQPFLVIFLVFSKTNCLAVLTSWKCW